MVTSSPAGTTKSAVRPKGALNWANVARTAIDAHGALHNLGELTTLLALLDDLAPVTAVELGTWEGGGSWALAQLPTVRRIVTVDVEFKPAAADRLSGLKPVINLLTGNTTHPGTQKAVTDLLGDVKADVVLVDGGHDYKTARSDVEFAGRLSRPGGLVVVHDTQGHPDPVIMDVPQLWAEIRAAYRTTELVDHLGGPGGTGLLWL